MLALGIDIGTTTISAVVVEDRKRVLCSVTENSHAALRSANAWEVLQNAGDVVEKAEAITGRLIEKFPQIACIGVTGQMHGIVYVDGEGEIVSPLYTWLDNRGNCILDGEETYTEHVRRVTGFEVATGMGFVTHFYNLRNGLVPPEAAAFCTIYDCLAMRLCGSKRPVTHPSSVASFGLYDLAGGNYHRGSLERLHIGMDMCPVVVGDSFIGTTAEGIPVTVGIGDNQASFLGAVQDGERELLVNIGTGSQITFLAETPFSDDGFEPRPFVGDKYIMVGSSLGGGASLELLERFFCQVATMASGNEIRSCYTMIDACMENCAVPANPPKVNTRFFGTRRDPTATGSIMNLTFENFRVPDLIYGFFNGMAEELHQMFLRCGYPGKSALTRIIGSGNGLRKNAVLCDCIRDVFGMPFRISPFEEEASCGAAFFAQMCLDAGKNRYKAETKITA